jgi:hypothetical protein
MWGVTKMDANWRMKSVSATVLPELAADSVETAERLVRLSAEMDLDNAEAEYILGSGLAALQRVPGLWPIIRSRIGSGTTAAMAHRLLVGLQDALDKNLSLAATLKQLARANQKQGPGEPVSLAQLDAAEDGLREIRAEVARLSAVLDAPARWPGEETFRKAREDMQRGDRVSAEQVRQALAGE